MEPSQRTEDLYTMLQKEQERADLRFRALTQGCSVVLSLFVPGLGMLFLRWYKWAVAYFAAVALMVANAPDPRPSSDARLLWYAWLGLLGLIWIANVVHAGLAATYVADRIAER